MASATRKYELIMPGAQVVQKFYLDSDNIAYALQMYGQGGKDMKLAYGKIDPSQTEINFNDSNFTQTSLTNFGHGQTFEPFTAPDGTKWAWVVTYASSTETDSNGTHWASRLGVIPLVPGTASIDASSVHSITYLNYFGNG